MEAVRTNVIGAENVMRAAIAQKVNRCVVLSTDKAVYPINAMGMSKAMMEKVMVAKSRLGDPGKTVLSATRYGNVMASRGSVIPLFLEQIREGKAADDYRSEHDPLSDDSGGVGGSWCFTRSSMRSREIFLCRRRRRPPSAILRRR